jgi:hypothetical protein
MSTSRTFLHAPAMRLTICNVLDPLFRSNPHILIHRPRQDGKRNQIRTSGDVVLELAGCDVKYGLVVKKFDSQLHRCNQVDVRGAVIRGVVETVTAACHASSISTG